MQEKKVLKEEDLRGVYRRRAQEFKKAAEIFKKAGNLEAYEDCLECAFMEELMAERGLRGNLFVTKHIRA